MKRFVPVAMLAFAAFGCAAGVDDPTPEPTPVVQPRANKTFSGTTQDPVVDDRQAFTDWGALRVGAPPVVAPGGFEPPPTE
jgi:hypothetical protein